MRRRACTSIGNEHCGVVHKLMLNGELIEGFSEIPPPPEVLRNRRPVTAKSSAMAVDRQLGMTLTSSRDGAPVYNGMPGPRHKNKAVP